MVRTKNCARRTSHGLAPPSSARNSRAPLAAGFEEGQAAAVVVQVCHAGSAATPNTCTMSHGRGSGACVLNAVVGPPGVNMGHNEASACIAEEQEYASMGRSDVGALIVNKKSRMHNNNKNKNPQTLLQSTMSHLNLRALCHTSTSEHYVTPQPRSTMSHLNLRALCHTSTSEHYVKQNVFLVHCAIATEQ